MPLVFSLVAITLGSFVFGVLGILAYLETSTGDPETGRLYFSDILARTPSGGVTPLRGSLTTFSYSLLVLAAFSGSITAYIRHYDGRGAWFWSVTAALLALAGLDERFVLHETIGRNWRINDSALVAAYPIVLLIASWWGRNELLRFRGNFWLGIPVVLATGIYLYVDTFFPRDQSYRLLLEDGAKLVAVASLFLFYFKCMMDELDRLMGRIGAQKTTGGAARDAE